MSTLLVRATLPATVGEWIQGWIEGRESLVSLVVSWQGSVALRLGRGSGFLPKKASRAWSDAKRRFPEIPEACVAEVCNPVPVSRGFATSTMDIAGVYAAGAASAGEELGAEELFALCAGIEPSDGIMFDGLALVDHLRGELIERLPAPPALRLVCFVPNETLDTADYHRDDALPRRYRDMAGEYAAAYGLLKRALLQGDAAGVAQAATRSAELHQRIRPRPEWPALRAAAAAAGALGLAVAHSGTASALLFAPTDCAGVAAATAHLAGICGDVPGGAVVENAVSTGGGVRLERRFPECGTSGRVPSTGNARI